MVAATVLRIEHEMAKPRERPLAWHLAALCFALALPILILIAMLTWSHAEAEHTRIEQDAVRSAHDVMAATDRELAGLIATTKVLAASQSLQRDDLDAFDAQARNVYREIGINVVLRNRESQQIVNTRLPRGAPLPTNVDKESDLAVLATKKPFVSNLFVGGVTRKPVFIVNVPILRNGRVVYFLNLSLPPERMRDLIIETGIPVGWTAAVVDRRGFVVAHSNRHEAMLNRQLPNSILSKLSGRDGVFSAENKVGDDQPVLIAYSRSRLSGWTAVVTLPAEQAKAPLRIAIFTLIGVGGGVSVLSLGLAFAFSRRIEGPVDALSVQAAQVGADETVRPLATAIREVNVLSKVLSDANRKRREADVALRASEQRLRELQFELLHASRLSTMGQMAAALAHELNQPLGAATNFLSAAQLGLKSGQPDSSARALARVEKAIEQTVRAGAILGRLRDFIARGETEKEVAVVSQLIKDAVSLALVGVKDPYLRIQLDLKSDEPTIVDRIQIQQVVFNLVRNALEATEGRKPREIVVAARPTGNSELEISVSDNGCGLPEDPEAVFRPFTSTKLKGMGVGLSICRLIVEAHGGRLLAEPRTTGGTVFRFTLPIAREAAHA